MSQGTVLLRLPPMPKIADIIRLYGLTARKQLSQNFILDLNITDKIVRKADVFDCHVCEIGAGPGSLTRSLLQSQVRHVAAVEIDKRFMPSLQMLEEASEGRLSVHQSDIMNFDIPKALPKAMAVPWEREDLPGVRLVGNLPFSVAIPLLLQWLEALSVRQGPFVFGRVPMCLVFQRELAKDLTSDPFDPCTSRLTVMTKNLCDVKIVYKLSRQVFVPEPKVDACLVRFTPKVAPSISAPFYVVEQVVKGIFSMKRKIIKTSLKSLFPGREELVTDLLNRADVDPQLRSYYLKLEDYDKLCSAFMHLARENNLSLTPLPMFKPSPIPGLVRSTA